MNSDRSRRVITGRTLTLAPLDSVAAICLFVEARGLVRPTGRVRRRPARFGRGRPENHRVAVGGEGFANGDILGMFWPAHKRSRRGRSRLVPVRSDREASV